MKKSVEERNCFDSNDWYQPQCEDLKSYHLSIKNKACLPFDYDVDTIAYFRRLPKEELRKRANHFNLSSYDSLDDEYLIRTLSIMSLLERSKKYEKGQRRFHEKITKCAKGRNEQYEHCNKHPGWNENEGHKFAREHLTQADEDCRVRLENLQHFVRGQQLEYEEWLAQHQTSLTKIEESPTQSPSLPSSLESPTFQVTVRDFARESLEEEKRENERRRKEERASRQRQEELLDRLLDEKRKKDEKRVLLLRNMGDKYFHNVRKNLVKLEEQSEHYESMMSFPWLKEFSVILSLFNSKVKTPELSQSKKIFEKVKKYDPPLNVLAYGDFNRKCIVEFFEVMIENGSGKNIIIWASFLEPFIFYQDPKFDPVNEVLKGENSFGKTGYEYLTPAKGLYFFSIFFNVYANKSFQLGKADHNKTIFKLMSSMLDLSTYQPFLNHVGEIYKRQKLSYNNEKLLSEMLTYTQIFMSIKVSTTLTLYEIWKINFGPHEQVCQDVIDAYQRLMNVIHFGENKKFVSKVGKVKTNLKLAKVGNDLKDELVQMAEWYQNNCKIYVYDDNE